jgi:hypothetical protein
LGKSGDFFSKSILIFQPAKEPFKVPFFKYQHLKLLIQQEIYRSR